MNTIMNMESFLKSVVIVMLVMFFLVGCVAVKPTDVSEQEPYISTLGYKFKSKIDLVAHGITYAQNYKGDADYVFLKGR